MSRAPAKIRTSHSPFPPMVAPCALPQLYPQKCSRFRRCWKSTGRWHANGTVFEEKRASGKVIGRNSKNRETAETPKIQQFQRFYLAPPRWFEHPTHGLGNRRSIPWATGAQRAHQNKHFIMIPHLRRRFQHISFETFCHLKRLYILTAPWT